MCFVIAVLGFAAYITSFSGQFIWDDMMLIRDNPLIRSPFGVLKFFAADIGSGGGARFGFYRPIQMLSYMADYHLWGLFPGGYHFFSTVLHVLVSLCVFWFALLLTQESMLAFIAGILYTVHPVHVDAVAYISGRADSLAVLFTMIAVCLYIKIASPPCFLAKTKRGDEAISSKNKARLTAFMALSCALALFSREFAVVQPGLLIAYHFAYRRKVWWKGFWIISGITALYVVLRLTALKFIISGVSYPTTVAQRLPGFFAAMSGYLRLMFLPFGLHNEYGHPFFSFSNPRVIVGILLVAGLLFYALTQRRRDPLGVFCIGWFFVSLSLVTNIYPPVNAYMLEHWMYAPSMGFFLVAARFISHRLRPCIFSPRPCA